MSRNVTLLFPLQRSVTLRLNEEDCVDALSGSIIPAPTKFQKSVKLNEKQQQFFDRFKASQSEHEKNRPASGISFKECKPVPKTF